jgi:hypothetical protein
VILCLSLSLSPLFFFALVLLFVCTINVKTVRNLNFTSSSFAKYLGDHSFYRTRNMVMWRIFMNTEIKFQLWVKC